MNVFKKNKGITLISLIITIVVLLILAGITINSLTGSENAMEKATEAREENKLSEELEQIKLCVINAMAQGLDGKISANDLQNQLNGILAQTEIEKITGVGPWIIQGISGRDYKITNGGLVSPLLTIDNAIINEIAVDVGSTIPLSIINSSEIEEIQTCSIAKVTPEGGTETTVASVAKNNTTKIWEITGISLPTVPEDAESVETTLIITGKSGKAKEINLIVRKIDPPKRGDYIILNNRAITGVGPANTDNTSNTSNEDDWLILYNGMNEIEDSDKKGLFIIMSNYLPNAYKSYDSDTYGVAKKAGLEYGTGDFVTYGVYGSSQSDLINKLMPKNETDEIQSVAATAWKSLISNDIITAYPTTKVYGALDKVTMDKIKGTHGYYLPWTNGYKNSVGYWLASPHASKTNRLLYIHYEGYTSDSTYNNAFRGICPIVILPQNIKLIKNSNGIWEVNTTQMVDNN